MPDAFKHQDGAQIPLVWQHGHNDPENVLGHALLENRSDGVYAYCYFNKTSKATTAKELLLHGDINSLSIWANRLVEQGKNVLHGAIKEVSLVLAGANPGALIDNINIQHSDGDVETLGDEAIIYTGLNLEHAEPPKAGGSDPTVQEVFDSMTEEQQNVVNYLIGAALEMNAAAAAHSDSDDSENAEETEETEEAVLTHQEGTVMNVFEQNGGSAPKGATLSHDDLAKIVANAKRLGSFKEAFLEHATTYGIENIDLLFPDAKAISNSPEFVSRRMEWVAGVIGGTHHSPFSRIKSLSADITHDEARAKGYVKASMKKEEFFALAKRVTTPQTIYKKQKLDRDDIIDITDLDVVAWLKAEMRVMLDEEIARAVLIGDGREVDDEDKIQDTHIRPIAKDDNFYAHQVAVPSNVTGDSLVEAILRARPNYRGSGNPAMYCTENLLTDLLLVKDRLGRRIYPTQAELETALRVSKIVTVPVMESQNVNGGELLAVLVNLNDYTLGADKGGAVSMFDDFDIDYNQYKYLIEARLSGALTKYKSAMVFTRATGTSVTPGIPTFVPSTGVVTIPNTAGVEYFADGAAAPAGALAAINAGDSVTITAEAADGYYFPANTPSTWTFTRPSA
jgi:hypothetical protein